MQSAWDLFRRMALFTERQSSGSVPKQCLGYWGFRKAAIAERKITRMSDNLHPSLPGEKASVIFFL